jgi:ferrous iron transport protein B|tara:strand:- start:2329 stop:4503 length:2175 start_codon:yes stop_codon:yes gene_type:complete
VSLITIALIGNPNAGKTTLFNRLTGSHQKVGNWPGVTVEQKVGTFALGDQQIQLVDLPGIYSLEQEYLGLDEKIALDFLRAGDVDLVINILDATNLERNLVLTQQLVEESVPMVIALNMLDVAEQQGVKIDIDTLRENLGIDVYPIVASRAEGVEALSQKLEAYLTDLKSDPDASKSNGASTNLATGGAADTDRLSPDDELTAPEKLIRRYHRSTQLVNGAVEVSPVFDSLTERIDRWVLNKWLGIPFFLFMMYLMFTVAVNVGAVFIDFFDILFAAVFVDGFRWLLESAAFPQWTIVLLADGLGGGIQLVATFIPVIGLLFLCLSVLEDSGYMSRAAFVVDSLMSKLGLPGSAFVPLIVGFGCNVPAVMASRTLGRDSDRLMTIAMAPFMSCGARLTVYALFAAAFFQSNGQNVVFGLYLLGILLAVITGFIFRRQIFGHEITPSFQEMPAYHIPVLRNILITTWFRLKSFVFRAGKTIVLVVIALSFLNSISTDGSFGNEDSEASALSTIGKKITPIFAPIGVQEDNWPATVGLFTGIFAKEAVVGTLDALYTAADKDDSTPDIMQSAQEAVMSIVNNGADLLGGLADPLGLGVANIGDVSIAAQEQGVQSSTLTNMAALFGSQLAAFSYLVFILLYAPCVAVLGAITKEAGWRWMVLIFTWTTTVAYVSASNIYQLGTFTDHPTFSMMWLLGSVLVMWLFIHNLKRIGRRSANLIPAIQVS